MTDESTDRECGVGRRGFGKFIETLLAGIPWSERAEETETIHVPRPPGGNLRIDNANGRTRVVGEDRGDIEIQLSKAARAESVEQARRLVEAIRVVPTEDAAGDLNLDVEIPGRWNRRGRVDMELRIPRELKVQVIAANGKVCVQGLRDSVRARSSNGAVRIEDVIGDVEIHTSNAKVSCLCTCGHLVARSSNGRIELEDHRGSVDAATSNGTIHCELEDVGKSGVDPLDQQRTHRSRSPRRGRRRRRHPGGQRIDPQLPGTRSPLPGAQRARQGDTRPRRHPDPASRIQRHHLDSMK